MSRADAHALVAAALCLAVGLVGLGRLVLPMVRGLVDRRRW